MVSAIKRGYLVLVGVSRDDTPEDAEYILRKLLGLRLFEDDQRKPWAQTVVQRGFEILSVSQFTLYAKTSKGAKPDFHLAMPGELSRAFYHQFLDDLRRAYSPDKVQDGVFGAMMDVHLVNDGPVTITLDSVARDPATRGSPAAE